ncbi:hypothetical protein F5148DRAFT_1252790 [Russula earlei]|uniref:Uncharacterized protein n=1 Tax=Russula earlei TaxID=71964 RepID=A0ACC0TU65_9AGAM|nr:hypothetical protein F5148DRAFT_1252790 [Russula earlei]
MPRVSDALVMLVWSALGHSMGVWFLTFVSSPFALSPQLFTVSVVLAVSRFSPRSQLGHGQVALHSVHHDCHSLASRNIYCIGCEPTRVFHDLCPSIVTHSGILYRGIANR